MRVEKGRRAGKAVLVLGLATLLLGACAYGTPYGGYSGYGHRYGGGYYSSRAPYGYTHRSAYGSRDQNGIAGVELWTLWEQVFTKCA